MATLSQVDEEALTRAYEILTRLGNELDWVWPIDQAQHQLGLLRAQLQYGLLPPVSETAEMKETDGTSGRGYGGKPQMTDDEARVVARLQEVLMAAGLHVAAHPFEPLLEVVLKPSLGQGAHTIRLRFEIVK